MLTEDTAIWRICFLHLQKNDHSMGLLVICTTTVPGIRPLVAIALMYIHSVRSVGEVLASALEPVSGAFMTFLCPTVRLVPQSRLDQAS